MKITIISAGIQVPSSSSKLAKIYEQQLDSLSIETKTVELRNLGHDIIDNILVGFPSTALKNVLDDVYSSDAVIFVTPVYNASFNTLFKGFVDILDPEKVSGLPVIIAATGGTVRHSLVLDYAIKPIFGHLHMSVAEHLVFVATDDWADSDNNISERVKKNVNSLLKFAENAEPRKDVNDFLNNLNFG